MDLLLLLFGDWGGDLTIGSCSIPVILYIIVNGCPRKLLSRGGRGGEKTEWLGREIKNYMEEVGTLPDRGNARELENGGL